MAFFFLLLLLVFFRQEIGAGADQNVVPDQLRDQF